MPGAHEPKVAGAAGLTFGASEEITGVLKRSAVLEGQAHQASDYVIEVDQFRRTAQTFQVKEDFGGVGIVIDADVQRPLIGNPDLWGDVRLARGEDGTLAQDGCSVSLGVVSVWRS